MQLLFDTERGDVGVQNDPAHRSAEVRTPHRAQISNELFDLAVSEDTLACQVISGLHRLRIPEKLVNRGARATRPRWLPCTGCGHDAPPASRFYGQCFTPYSDSAEQASVHGGASV